MERKVCNSEMVLSSNLRETSTIDSLEKELSQENSLLLKRLNLPVPNNIMELGENQKELIYRYPKPSYEMGKSEQKVIDFDKSPCNSTLLGNTKLSNAKDNNKFNLPLSTVNDSPSTLSEVQNLILGKLEKLKEMCKLTVKPLTVDHYYFHWRTIVDARNVKQLEPYVLLLLNKYSESLLESNKADFRSNRSSTKDENKSKDFELLITKLEEIRERVSTNFINRRSIGVSTEDLSDYLGLEIGSPFDKNFGGKILSDSDKTGQTKTTINTDGRSIASSDESVTDTNKISEQILFEKQQIFCLRVIERLGDIFPKFRKRFPSSPIEMKKNEYNQNTKSSNNKDGKFELSAVYTGVYEFHWSKIFTAKKLQHLSPYINLVFHQLINPLIDNLDSNSSFTNMSFDPRINVEQLIKHAAPEVLEDTIASLQRIFDHHMYTMIFSNESSNKKRRTQEQQQEPNVVGTSGVDVGINSNNVEECIAALSSSSLRKLASALTQPAVPSSSSFQNDGNSNKNNTAVKPTTQDFYNRYYKKLLAPAIGNPHEDNMDDFKDSFDLRCYSLGHGSSKHEYKQYMGKQYNQVVKNNIKDESGNEYQHSKKEFSNNSRFNGCHKSDNEKVPQAGYPNVSYDGTHNRWIAFWRNEGKNHSKSFSCNKNGGIETARMRAVEFKKEMDLKLFNSQANKIVHTMGDFDAINGQMNEKVNLESMSSVADKSTSSNGVFNSFGNTTAGSNTQAIIASPTTSTLTETTRRISDRIAERRYSNYYSYKDPCYFYDTAAPIISPLASPQKGEHASAASAIEGDVDTSKRPGKRGRKPLNSPNKNETEENSPTKNEIKKTERRTRVSNNSHVNDPNNPFRLTGRSRVISGSITFDRSQNRFMAQWKTSDGTKHSKSFYIKNYGSYEEAKSKASEFRQLLLEDRDKERAALGLKVITARKRGVGVYGEPEKPVEAAEVVEVTEKLEENKTNKEEFDELTQMLSVDTPTYNKKYMEGPPSNVMMLQASDLQGADISTTHTVVECLLSPYPLDSPSLPKSNEQSNLTHKVVEINNTHTPNMDALNSSTQELNSTHTKVPCKIGGNTLNPDSVVVECS